MYEGLDHFSYVTGPLEVDRLNEPWLVAARGRWVTKPQVPVYGGVLPYANGCNIGVRRDLWTAVGGFDESMSSGEDVEFALRMHMKGAELGWAPGALVHYRYRPELTVLWRQGRAYGGIQPELLSRIRAAGLRPSATRIPWRNFLWSIRHLGLLTSHQGRARWLWVSANVVGYLDGLRRRSRRA
jgi:GT2 family glycosyltransferase